MPKRKTTEEYKNEVESITNNEYTILSEYKTQNDKILFKHLKCGREYLSTPKNFNRGRRCSHCNNNKKPKTTEEFSKEVTELTNGEYILVSEYGLNNKEKVTIKHLKCNKEFKIQPYNFSNNGIRCPYCKESSGEYKIRKFLENNHINYEKEFKFEDLYDKQYLRFDFKVNINNSFILIEYDGLQHYHKAWFDTKDNFILRKKHDKMKDDYCKKNNIDLIRISYKDFDNIEEILKEELTFND